MSDIDSDSIVGSCDCLTKTPEAKYHKNACKYRLIVERDQARDLAQVSVQVLDQILGAIPQSRDWLDPDLEWAAKSIVKKSKTELL